MTTIETITDEQIEALRIEAGEAGDTKQVAICDRALDKTAEHEAVLAAGPITDYAGGSAEYHAAVDTERARIVSTARAECVRVIRENEAQR